MRLARPNLDLSRIPNAANKRRVLRAISRASRVMPRDSPDKPTIGVRATRPNEIWHVDVSVVRLVDGTRVYLQAIIDNWSRKLLAFRVSSSFDGSATARLLTEAAHFLSETSAYDVQLFADAGVENLNTSVDAALDVLPIRRVLAQVDVTLSGRTLIFSARRT